MKELVQAMLTAQPPFSVVSSSSGRAYITQHQNHQLNINNNNNSNNNNNNINLAFNIRMTEFQT